MESYTLRKKRMGGGLTRLKPNTQNKIDLFNRLV